MKRICCGLTATTSKLAPLLASSQACFCQFFAFVVINLMDKIRPRDAYCQATKIRAYCSQQGTQRKEEHHQEEENSDQAKHTDPHHDCKNSQPIADSPAFGLVTGLKSPESVSARDTPVPVEIIGQLLLALGTGHMLPMSIPSQPCNRHDRNFENLPDKFAASTDFVAYLIRRCSEERRQL
jgi:hypothetical protein